jgi:hypothetical protein
VKVQDSNLVKGSWTLEEDKAIIDFVNENDPRNGVKLAELLPGRIGKQCHESWINLRSPEVARSVETAEKDAKLVDECEKPVEQFAQTPNRSNIEKGHRIQETRE